MENQEVLSFAAGFAIAGRPCGAEEITTGNINSTWRITTDAESGGTRYILQRINSYVFRDPEGVMRNISRVTAHIADAYAARGIESSRRVLRLVPALDGRAYIEAGGSVWRMYYSIEDAYTIDQSNDAGQFMEAGRAFGEFARMLDDFPARELAETIPDFHNTVKRYDAFLEAVKNDKAGRAASVAEEIAFFRERRDALGSIVQALESGLVPCRVTHNDTKINNVMMDRETGKAICVIDLDTVMPGSCLFDYGDAIRSGASTAAEDEPDLDKVKLDLELFRAFTDGYLSEMRDILTAKELELLPMSVSVLTCELAMRFLTDYLDGDLYFKIRTPDHNLIRARNQMALALDIERKFDAMREICRELCERAFS